MKINKITKVVRIRICVFLKYSLKEAMPKPDKRLAITKRGPNLLSEFMVSVIALFEKGIIRAKKTAVFISLFFFVKAKVIPRIKNKDASGERTGLKSG